MTTTTPKQRRVSLVISMLIAVCVGAWLYPRGAFRPKKVRVATAQSPGGIAADESGAYWGSGTKLVHWSPTGAVTTLAEGLLGSSDQSIVLDREGVFVLEGSQLSRVPKGGGAPRIVFRAKSSPHAIAIDDQNVYLAGSSLWAIPTGGGAPKVLCDVEAQSLAAMDAVLYAASAGALWRVPRDGSACAKLFELGSTDVHLAAGAPNLYWLKRGRSRVGEGELVRWSPSDESLHKLAVGLLDPTRLILDEKALSWIDTDEHEVTGIMRVRKAGGYPFFVPLDGLETIAVSVHGTHYRLRDGTVGMLVPKATKK